MTWTPTTSPMRPAAAAPASTAALTAATSPTTNAVTRPLPIFCQPMRVTLAALTIASLASISATRPLVSIMPRASRPFAIAHYLEKETRFFPCRVGRVFEAHRVRFGGPRRLGPPYRNCHSPKKLHVCRMRVVHRVALVGVDVDLQLARGRQAHEQVFQHGRA